MKKTTLLILAIFFSATIALYSQYSSDKRAAGDDENYTRAYVSYGDYKELVAEAESQREKNLVSLDKFVEMSKEENVVILDSRSDRMYNRKHIKGAIHLDFTDFTQEALNNLIPDPNTKILIYCNNNFENDSENFPTKKSGPSTKTKGSGSLTDDKSILLALNIPTFINLYGYGYKNIYELDELVNIYDKRIEFEGTDIQ